MESAIDPIVLGVLMTIITGVWFTYVSVAGMRQDDTVRTPKRDARDPWWAHEAFAHSPEAVTVRSGSDTQER